MKLLLGWLNIILLSLLLFSCSGGQKKVVAVSQCGDNDWLELMLHEMQREAFLHPELDVEYHTDARTSAEQIKTVEGFIDRKVDLIILAANESEAFTPVVEKAYDAGIPVVLVDRRVDTEKYTAYIGGDNMEVGRQAAMAITSHLPHGGNIVEIEGVSSSSSNKQRHDGFHEIIDRHPEIHVVGHGSANWEQKDGEALMDSISQELKDTPVDVVFAYNDEMAIGAHDSYKKHKDSMKYPMPKFVGVDAILTGSSGVDRIADGTLSASFLYPTGGDVAIDVAADILADRPFTRFQIMRTSMVTKGNVHLMQLQAQHIETQNKKIEVLNESLAGYFKQYSAQRVLIIVFVVLILLICAFLFVSIRAYTTKHRLNVKLTHQAKILREQRNELAEQKEVVEHQRDQLEDEKDKLIEAKILLEDQMRYRDLGLMNPQETEKAAEPAKEDDSFKTKLLEVINKHLDNSEANVDMIGAEVNLGRVQLYRKCKAATGMSPNELLRKTRLNKAYELLHTTKMTVSEVAYSVGFSSPSYLAKCYKDLYGENPTEAQKL